jgi:hypothetical protein
MRSCNNYTTFLNEMTVLKNIDKSSDDADIFDNHSGKESHQDLR